MSKHVIQIKPALSAKGVLITACSHLVDQHVPACEIILLPPKPFGGGTLSFEVIETVTGVSMASSVKGKIKQKLKALRLDQVLDRSDPLLMDVRLRSPGNWAHFLTNHLPIVFAICAQAGIAYSELTLILPKNTPSYILNVAALFGFPVLCTDTPVRGRCVPFEATPWIGIRSKRADWIREGEAPAALARAGVGERPDLKEIPDRVFISRRGTRRLENETQIKDHLSKRGFGMMYVEDLTVRDQFRLFEHARQIVAIHGAGLAPLLYRSHSARTCQVIELLPCSIMTDVFRVISGLVGCDWIGVRGKIKASYIEPLYDLERPFTSAVNDPFEVDLASLDLAFEMLGKVETGV